MLKIHHNLVAKAWQRAGLQPHRFERYMQSDDPDFEPKAADVIGLYVNPPDHAAVFAVDEKTAIQALDRLDPVLPLSPGRAERHGFEYYRHGTLSLFAALNTQSGEVLGQTVPRHTSAAFVDFLEDIVASQPKRRAIHVIADNLSTHKTQAVRTFLLEHPNVQLHFTPTYSSWLNQVELWFSKIERDLLARGIFTSVADLARKIRRYIHRYNKAPKPIRWAYRNPAHRIGSTSASTVHSQSITRSPDHQITQFEDSEQRDVHELAFLDDTFTGWNFDIAVRLREARDVAGSLERRQRHAIADADGVELMTTDGRRDPAAERRAHDTRPVRRQPRRRAEERHEQHVCVREA